MLQTTYRRAGNEAIGGRFSERFTGTAHHRSLIETTNESASSLTNRVREDRCPGADQISGLSAENRVEMFGQKVDVTGATKAGLAAPRLVVNRFFPVLAG